MQERIKVGRIIKYVPAYNYYTVKVDGEGQLYSGVMAQGGSGLAGSRQNVALVPNSMVLVYDAAMGGAGERVCYILGAVTPIATDGMLVPADQDAPNTGAGFLHDAVFNYPAVEDPQRDGAVHAGNQTPVDALPGEHTISNPIGPALHVGYFMAQLCASDRAAIQLFRDGELVRVMGREYQLHTFAEETEHHASEGELTVTRRVAMLPWEALGAFSKDQPVAKLSEEPQDDPGAPPEVPSVTTQEDNQRGIFRYQEHIGYMGDMYHRFVEVPISEAGLDTTTSPVAQHQGVFHEHIGADGSFLLQSAKSISLEKWNLIPVPLPAASPDDPAGDNATNYKVNGVVGEGPDNPREDFGFAGREDAAAHGMLGLELHGFAGDRMGLANLRAHTKDVAIAKEQDVPLASENGGLYPEYRLDPERMWMPLPKYRELVVQQGRWESVRYYASRSAIQQLDDGSIVLEDGYGSQIVMAGGNIRITCPGDVMLQPGRSLVAMAPQDAVVKAGNSVDITASRRDVRIKAENNLALLGGNSGTGGVLIESRDAGREFNFEKDGEGQDVQGLVLRNTRGVVAVLSKDLAITGLDASGTSVIQTRGEMVLRGQTTRVEAVETVTVSSGPVFETAAGQTYTSYMFGRTDMSFGVGTPVQAILNTTSTSIFGSTTVFGVLGVEGGAVMSGSLAVTGGVTSPSEMMALMQTSTSNQITAVIRTTRDSDTRTLDRTGQSLATDRKPLQSKAIKNFYFNDVESTRAARYTLRTDQDYHTTTLEQFVLPEARWQQYARLFGTGKAWQEPEVQGTTTNTAPWPGIKAWATDARLMRYEEKNFTASAGASTSGQDQKASIVPVTYQVLAQQYVGNTRS